MFNKKNKIMNAFSLAEVLITLLIVTILILASTPVITKKKKIPTEPHGKWMCTLNAQGQYVVWQNGNAKDMNDADTWDLTNMNKCVFKVPKNARNFAITAVGGGGGGAGAARIFKSWNGNGRVITIDGDPTKVGTYRMVAVGAGGSGGLSECNERETPSNAMNMFPGNRWAFGAGGGGGAGGAGYAEYYVDENTVSLTLTQGGSVSNTLDEASFQDGSQGGTSKIVRRYYNSNGVETTEELIVAEGGYGGQGMQHNCLNKTHLGYPGDKGKVTFPGKGEYISKKSSNSSSEIPYTKGKEHCSAYQGSSSDYDYRSGAYLSNKICFGYYTGNTLKKINDFIGYSALLTGSGNRYTPEQLGNTTGRGGNTGSTKDKKCKNVGGGVYCGDSNVTGSERWIRSDQSRITKSGDGFVGVSTYYVLPGGGGYAAAGKENIHVATFEKLKSIDVKIGAGGAGGAAGVYDSNNNVKTEPKRGGDGTDTIIGDNLYVFYGASGGDIKQSSSQKAGFGKIEGLDGERATINKSKRLIENTTTQEEKNLYKSGWGGMAHDNTSANGTTSLFYGAGGGGGGQDEDGNLGNGGAGSPGFVMIEW